MDIKGLQYFIAAGECLNFTHAAQQCFVTQTAMSLHIAKMEEELGFQLFKRTNRMVELTAAGKAFFEQAQRIVRQYDAAVIQSANIASKVAGDIGIMFPSCIEGLLLSKELRLFCGKYPRINLNIHIVEPKNMYEKLKNRECCVAICQPADFVDMEELEILPFRQYPIRVCVAANHPLANCARVTPEQIRWERVMVLDPYSNPKSSRNTQNKWAAGGFELYSVIKTQRLEEILLMIELGLGIGLLPAYVHEYTGGSILSKEQHINFIEIEKDGLPPLQELVIIYRKDHGNPALANLLMGLVP